MPSGQASGDGEPTERSARAERAHAHAAALARAKAAESRAAAALIHGFVVHAREAAIPPTPLRARDYGGRYRFRTNVVGWYLRRDLSLGIGTDGRFYILSAPGGIGALLKGVELAPSDPPLQIGRGARDGESVALDVALERRLAAGADYPS